MIYILPFLISLTLGFFIVKAALNNRPPGNLLTLLLSATIGLGTSGLLTFTSFILFNQLMAWYVILINVALTAALGIHLKLRDRLHILSVFKTLTAQDALALGVLALITGGMFIYASLYPYGGWDAWGSWNFKARFLFLGGTEWTRMFDPILWRHQILYPFLLPLMNVWVWSFGNSPTYAVPLAMTCIIPFLTAGILFAALRELTGRWQMILVPLWIFSNIFVIQLSASQYSDLLLGLFLLTAMILFLLFQKTQETGYLFLMGLVLGIMSFTKVEGTTLGLITLGAALNLGTGGHVPNSKNEFGTCPRLNLIGATVLASFATIIFTIFYLPKDGHIFINGLTSNDHPASWERLGVIIRYYGKEFISMKWSGLWLALAAILVVGGKRTLRRELWIFPIVLGLYAIVFTATYAINTFYEIIWWLDTSLHRILLTLIPVTALWAFLAMEKE